MCLKIDMNTNSQQKEDHLSTLFPTAVICKLIEVITQMCAPSTPTPATSIATEQLLRHCQPPRVMSSRMKIYLQSHVSDSLAI